MKQIVLLLAVTAAALVTPNEAKKHQISLGIQNKPVNQNAVQAWWDELPDASSLLSPVQDRITKSIQRSTLDSILALVENDDDEEEEEDHLHPHPPHGGHGHHGDPDKTIYELIKASKHTTKFAKLVDEHDEIKKLLDDTEHNYTLFVPTDRAFERIPHHRHGHHGHHGDGDDDGDDDDKHDHKRCKEFVLSLLKYHIAPGLYPRSRIRSSHTLPTLLHTPALSTHSHDHDHDDDHDHDHDHDDNKNPQRIRAFTTPLLHFTRLNFHARLTTTTNHPARNGLIHTLDAVLLPPPSQTALVRLLPAQFSTLALALETTGLGAELDSHTPRAGGGTLFAPTNRAWARLGPRVNAFLFSERGGRYLRALVRYHVVVNETLYSDEFYRGGGGDEEEKGKGRDYWHVDLPSLLGGKPISVDVKTWKGFVSIVVNGFTRVVVRDGVADDGVVQVVGRVLIPPHEHHGGHGVGEMSLEELKSRLEPYLGDGDVAGGREEGMEDL